MVPINLFAREMFQNYRMKVGKDADTYVYLKVMAPHSEFPTYARMLWRHGMLCEIWGIIATKLDGTGKNYLRDWSKGQKWGEK